MDSTSVSSAAFTAHLYRGTQLALTTSGVERTEVVFVQDNLPDWETLARGVPDGTQVVVLDSRGNGLQQMADWLATQPLGGVDAIHLFSHGSAGQLNLGSATLAADNLSVYAAALDQVGKALSPGGDVLLYGCNVAAGEGGVTLVNGIATLTQADVAASDDLTGSASQRGDWVLEVRSGSADTQALAIADYAHTLLTVNDSFVTGLDFPGELLLDSQNNLYVNSSGNYKLFKFLAASGNVTGGAANSAFLTHSSSWGMSGSAIDASGNLYVGTGNGIDSVIKYAASGGLPGNTAPITIGSGFNLVADILATTDGKLLVTDNGANKVYLFSASGNFTPSSPLASATVTYAEQMYLDGSNNLYVASADSGKVIKFSAVGGAISLSNPSDFVTGLSSPRSITGDGAGNFYVGDGDEFGSDGHLYKFSSAGGVADVSTLQHTFTGVGIGELLWAGNDTLYAALSSGKVAQIGVGAAPNAAPTNVALSTSSVAENTSTASALTVGALSSTDPDSGDTFTYSIVGGTDQASFQISGSNLQFVSGTTLNYEAKGSYAVTVRTTDQGGLTFDKALTISVTNVNEKQALSVPTSQNVTQGTATALTGISVSDPDAGANMITVALSAPAGTFTATSGSGVTALGSGTASMTLSGTQTNINNFISASKVHYTTAAGATGSVTLSMGSNDGGNSGSGGTQTDSKTTTLNVVLPNSAPSLSGITTSTTINDTTTATPFSSLAIADADGDNVTVSVTLDTAAKGVFTSASLTASDFTSAGGGVYNLASTTAAAAQAAIRQLVFDPTDNRVTPASTETTTFTVSVNDGLNTAVTNNATTVTATSVNDTPANVALSANTVAENTSTASALTIGALSSTDADVGSTFTYSVVGGADQAKFQISGANLQFVAGTTLDYEAQNSYAVTVRSTDQGGLTYDKALTVGVSNVNEKPAITASASQNVTQATATVITGISLADPDSGVNLIDVSLSAPAGTFTAASSGGVMVTGSGTSSVTLTGTQTNINTLLSGGNVSYTTSAGATGTVTLTIGSNDGGHSGTGGTQTDSKTETLNIVIPNGAPAFTSGATGGVLENAATSTVVYTAATVDPENDVLTYALTGTDAASFSINASTGQMRLLAAANFEAQSSYSVTVNASDATNTTTKVVTVNVTDVNEVPARTAGSLVAVTAAEDSANSTAASLGLNMLTYDAGGDVGQTLTYTLANAPSFVTLFKADGTTAVGTGSTLTASELRGLTYKTVANGFGTGDITWTVVDSGGTANGGVNTLTQNLSVTINAVADTPSVTNSTTTAATQTTSGLVLSRHAADGAEVTHFKITGITNGTLYQADGTTVIANNGFITFAQGQAGLKFTPSGASAGSFAAQASSSNADAGLGGTAVNATITVTLPVPPAPTPEPEPAPVPAPTPAPAPSTDDGDGVSDVIESAVPSLPSTGGNTVVGDGNGDGIADTQQRGVVSTAFHHTPAVSANPNAPSTYVTLVVDSQGGKANASTATVTEIKQLDAPANMPAEMTSPLGLISFKASIAESGSSETFSLYVDAQLGVNGYWKQDAGGTWVNLASEAYGGKMVSEGGKLRLDFQIVDGGQFDSDGVANGSISDPGIVGAMAQSITEHHPKLPVVEHFWF